MQTRICFHVWWSARVLVSKWWEDLSNISSRYMSVNYMTMICILYNIGLFDKMIVSIATDDSDCRWTQKFQLSIHKTGMWIWEDSGQSPYWIFKLLFSFTDTCLMYTWLEFVCSYTISSICLHADLPPVKQTCVSYYPSIYPIIYTEYLCQSSNIQISVLWIICLHADLPHEKQTCVSQYLY